jgi:hypothetical protein
MRAFAEGLNRHNISTYVQRLTDEWQPSQPPDFVVLWGLRPQIPEPLKDVPRLYLEAGYINGKGSNYVQNRLRFISTSWNRLHGEADPLTRRDYSRWNKLNVPMFPWRKPASNRALVLMQHPSDAVAFDACYPNVHKELLKQGWRVKMRRHPLVAPEQESLDAAFAECDICVTYCSTAAVESVLLGIPTIVLSRRAIAWPVASHNITDDLYTDDRYDWCIDIANRQWTLEELRTGEAWDILSL